MTTVFDRETLGTSVEINDAPETLQRLTSAYEARRARAAERLSRTLHAALKLSTDQAVVAVDRVVTYRYENGNQVEGTVLVRTTIEGTDLRRPQVRWAAIAPTERQQLPVISEADAAFLDIPERFEVWAAQALDSSANTRE